MLPVYVIVGSIGLVRCVVRCHATVVLVCSSLLATQRVTQGEVDTREAFLTHEELEKGTVVLLTNRYVWRVETYTVGMKTLYLCTDS